MLYFLQFVSDVGDAAQASNAFRTAAMFAHSMLSLAAAPPPPPIDCYESMCADAGYPCFTPNCNEWNASHVPNGDFTNTCGPVTSWATCTEMNNSFAKGQCKFNWDFRGATRHKPARHRPF